MLERKEILIVFPLMEDKKAPMICGTLTYYVDKSTNVLHVCEFTTRANTSGYGRLLIKAIQGVCGERCLSGIELCSLAPAVTFYMHFDFFEMHPKECLHDVRYITRQRRRSNGLRGVPLAWLC